MVTIIEKKRAALESLCEQHCVQRLELFGSALREAQFNIVESDLDFLVEFLPLESGHKADAYFGLREGLETLFQRPVDLVVTRAIKNPFFRQVVERDGTQLYAA